MTDEEKREKLVEFLDRKAFDPILRTSSDRYESKEKKRMLEDARDRTEREKKRYHENYPTAKDVKRNYLKDLNSEAAKQVNEELEKLGLPRLIQFEGEFIDLCDELDVD